MSKRQQSKNGEQLLKVKNRKSKPDQFVSVLVDSTAADILAPPQPNQITLTVRLCCQCHCAVSVTVLPVSLRCQYHYAEQLLNTEHLAPHLPGM